MCTFHVTILEYDKGVKDLRRGKQKQNGKCNFASLESAFLLCHNPVLDVYTWLFSMLPPSEVDALGSVAYHLPTFWMTMMLCLSLLDGPSYVWGLWGFGDWLPVLLELGIGQLGICFPSCPKADLTFIGDIRDILVYFLHIWVADGTLGWLLTLFRIDGHFCFMLQILKKS